MNADQFEQVVRDQIERCTNVLLNKAREYASDGDRLHNFRAAAGMTGETIRSALAGMMMKHTVSVYDMCRDDRPYSLELWNEKITDHINYLLLLRAIVEEESRNDD